MVVINSVRSPTGQTVVIWSSTMLSAVVDINIGGRTSTEKDSHTVCQVHQPQTNSPRVQQAMFWNIIFPLTIMYEIHAMIEFCACVYMHRIHLYVQALIHHGIPSVSESLKHLRPLHLCMFQQFVVLHGSTVVVINVCHLLTMALHMRVLHKKLTSLSCIHDMHTCMELFKTQLRVQRTWSDFTHNKVSACWLCQSARILCMAGAAKHLYPWPKGPWVTWRCGSKTWRCGSKPSKAHVLYQELLALSAKIPWDLPIWLNLCKLCWVCYGQACPFGLARVVAQDETFLAF